MKKRDFILHVLKHASVVQDKLAPKENEKRHRLIRAMNQQIE